MSKAQGLRDGTSPGGMISGVQKGSERQSEVRLADTSPPHNDSQLCYSPLFMFEFHCKLFSSPSSLTGNSLSSWFIRSARSLYLSVYLSAVFLCLLRCFFFLKLSLLVLLAASNSLSLPPTHPLPPIPFLLSFSHDILFSLCCPDPWMLIGFDFILIHFLPFGRSSSVAKTQGLPLQSGRGGSGGIHERRSALNYSVVIPSPFSLFLSIPLSQGKLPRSLPRNLVPQMKLYVAICVIFLRLRAKVVGSIVVIEARSL